MLTGYENTMKLKRYLKCDWFHADFHKLTDCQPQMSWSADGVQREAMHCC